MLEPTGEGARDRFAVEFAKVAADRGWSASTHAAFCAAQGIDRKAARRIWPRAHRSVSWDLTAFADRTLASACDSQTQPLASLIRLRFQQNRELHRSVARLALSDVFHPIDTIRRTRPSAHLMLALADLPKRRVLHARLVVAYSACVIRWIMDKSPDQSRSQRDVGSILRLFGFTPQ